MSNARTSTAPREYSPIVAQLLALGEPPGSGKGGGAWRDAPPADYAAMSLRTEHVPELVALVTDRAAIDGPDPLFFGPVHAARALLALRVEAAIPALIDALRLACNLNFDFWAEDLSGDFGIAVLGPAVIDPICKVARDQRESFGLRITLFAVLEKLAESPEHGEATRERVVSFLRELLRLARYNDPALNGSIISALAELRAIESLPEIHAAYQTVNRPGRTRSGFGGVDEIGVGTLETVEKRMRATPADRLRERMKWVESSIVEIKNVLASRAERQQREADDPARRLVAGSADPHAAPIGPDDQLELSADLNEDDLDELDALEEFDDDDDNWENSPYFTHEELARQEARLAAMNAELAAMEHAGGST